MEFSVNLRKTFSVRFIGITEAEIEILKNSFNIPHKSLMPYEEKKDTYVLVYSLTEEFDGKLVSNCLKSIDVVTCDVFVSVRTDNESQTVAIPKYVTKFVSDSGAELTFSFTVT